MKPMLSMLRFCTIKASRYLNSEYSCYLAANLARPKALEKPGVREESRWYL